MFNRNEQLTLSLFKEKKVEENILMFDDHIELHRGEFIETIKIKNIKRLLYSSSNKYCYIQKTNSIYAWYVTLDTLNVLRDKYDLELLTCFKYKEIACMLNFEDGTEKYLGEI